MLSRPEAILWARLDSTPSSRWMTSFRDASIFRSMRASKAINSARIVPVSLLIAADRSAFWAVRAWCRASLVEAARYRALGRPSRYGHTPLAWRADSMMVPISLENDVRRVRSDPSGSLGTGKARSLSHALK